MYLNNHLYNLCILPADWWPSSWRWQCSRVEHTEAIGGAVSISTPPSRDYHWLFCPKHTRSLDAADNLEYKDTDNERIWETVISSRAMPEDTDILPIQMTEIWSSKHDPHRKQSASATDANISVGSQTHRRRFISDPARAKHNLGIRTRLVFFLASM